MAIKRLPILILLLAIPVWASDGTVTHGTGSTGTIEQYGITWTFDKNLQTEAGDATHYQYGQFVTGDYYIVGNCTINSVDPATATGAYDSDGSTRTIHGSMVNPSANYQAYDSEAGFFHPELCASFPLALTAGQSLVSTISRTTFENVNDVIHYNLSYNSGKLKTAAVLTCLAEAPAANSFRPAYFGTDKTIYTKAGINYALLPNKALPATWANKSALEAACWVWPNAGDTSMVQTYARYFKRPWILHNYAAYGRPTHPCDNMPNYHREVLRTVSAGAALLMLDIDTIWNTEDLVDTLLIPYIQLGIDQYGIMKVATMQPSLSDSSCTQWPVIFAGTLLNVDGMKTIAYVDRMEWQTYYVNSGATWTEDVQSTVLSSVIPVGSINSYLDVNGRVVAWRKDPGNQEYEHLDPTTEWMLVSDQSYNGKMEAYRQLESGGFVGMTLASQLMSAQASWNHAALFDYAYRWMELESNKTSIRQGTTANQSAFINGMWIGYGVEASNNPVLTAIGSKTVMEGSALTFTVAATGGTAPYTYTATYNGGALPTGATLTDDDFAWTPGETQSGAYTILFTVTDNASNTDSESVLITVSDFATPTKPVITQPASQNAVLNSAFTLALSATKDTGRTLTWTIENAPTGITINSGTGAITGTPTNPGRWTVKVVATDDAAPTPQTDTMYFVIDCNNGTHPAPFAK